VGEVFGAADSLFAQENPRKWKHGDNRSQPIEPKGAPEFVGEAEQAIDTIKEINDGTVA
jgi:hypothetical protein